MSSREKIILLIAVLMGCYGLLDVFVISGGTGSGNDKNEVEAAEQAFETVVETAVASLAVPAAMDRTHMAALISRIESDWHRDPFSGDVGEGAGKVAGKSEMTGPDFVYSGFIQAGERVLAVVNGMEYGTGELITGTEYEVQKITASLVILQAEANREIKLYLKEN